MKFVALPAPGPKGGPNMPPKKAAKFSKIIFSTPNMYMLGKKPLYYVKMTTKPSTKLVKFIALGSGAKGEGGTNLAIM